MKKLLERFGLSLIFVGVLGCSSDLTHAGFMPLTEKMTPEYYDTVYQPLRTRAEKLSAVGQYLRASHAYSLASQATKFSAVRAAMIRNQAYEVLKFAQTGIGPEAGLIQLKDCERIYNEALGVLVVADYVGGRDASRALTRKHINMGLSWLRHLKANPEMLLVARKDL